MSKKMALPDALLDAISGGVLTYGGEDVLDIAICTDGFEITTSKGTEGVAFSPDMQRKHDAGDPAFDQMIDGLEKVHGLKSKHSLEDLLGIK